MPKVPYGSYAPAYKSDNLTGSRIKVVGAVM
jgi:hypothetical protein